MKTITSNRKLLFLALWLIVFGLCIVVRLPHFLSHNFFFDGDEAVIGIMARDFINGRSFPVYFYGQNYGLSFFETLPTAFFMKFFGSSIWALRLGSLVLYSLGITFIWQCFIDNNTSRKISYILIGIMILFPTWYLWGAMVRGGYLTAFTSICLLYYITQSMGVNLIRTLLTGVISLIAFESNQLIFFISTPPDFYLANIY